MCQFPLKSITLRVMPYWNSWYLKITPFSPVPLDVVYSAFLRFMAFNSSCICYDRMFNSMKCRIWALVGRPTAKRSCANVNSIAMRRIDRLELWLHVFFHSDRLLKGVRGLYVIMMSSISLNFRVSWFVEVILNGINVASFSVSFLYNFKVRSYKILLQIMRV